MSADVLLTVDVEDWFQVENLRERIPVAEWGGLELRVADSTRRILNLLDQKGTEQGGAKATFFVLGWIGERAPELVREIRDRGHEVASHGYGHLLATGLDIDSFSEDLRRGKGVLEDILGQEVCGYRAPSFAIDMERLEAVAGAGYRYSSSYNDFSAHPRYGVLDLSGRQRPGLAYDLGDGFFELPVSNLHFAGKTIPWGGGGYFRLVPGGVFAAGVKKIVRDTGGYVFYTHPWEYDPEQPRVDGLSMSNRFKHYVNIDKTLSRLGRLVDALSGCAFTTCRDYLAGVRGSSSPSGGE